LVPEEEAPLPLLDAGPPDEEPVAALPPPELALLFEGPLPPKPPPPVGVAELHPANPSENATANTETMSVRSMTTPRLIKSPTADSWSYAPSRRLAIVCARFSCAISQ
jgi:hypothetical protein